LTAKSHKDVVKNKFIWTDIDQKAFDFLCTCLITPPLLAYPDFNLKFLLFTDACDYRIGSVLSQTDLPFAQTFEFEFRTTHCL
jgi:hypothetical protein